MWKALSAVVGVLSMVVAFGAAGRAQAVTFSYTGTVTETIGTGPNLDGTVGTGTFSFKKSDVVWRPNGRGFVSGGDLDVSFTIFGQTFTSGEDLDFPAFPVLKLTAKGRPRFLNFFVSETGGNPVAIDDPSVLAFFTTNRLVKNGLRSYAGELTAASTGATVVPLPAALPLMIGGLAAFGLVGLRRRRTAAA